MKKIVTRISLAFVFLCLLTTGLRAQITCSSLGNLWVYANYDGGVLNINVDVNIPNIKIGICTYEPTTINISGAYVGNVTEVRYAGYVSTTNHHCNNSPTTTTITGVPGNITSVNFLPPATLSNPNGYSSIVCAYSCATNSNQGGCNTADQIKAYFQTSMGGTLTSYFTQYGCWSTQPYTLSSGGNCCSSVQPCNVQANAGPDQSICPSGFTTLNGSSTGGTTYTWAPTTGLSNPNSAITQASPSVTTTYILTASDGGICSDQDTVVVTVLQPVATQQPFGGLCLDASPLTLSGGSPSGGTYSGPGVSNGVFDPQVAGVGTHTISYLAIDGNGCSALVNTPITVYGLPTVSLGPVGPYCENDPVVTLSSGSPSGGSYSGTGVIGNSSFDPGTAGAGTHALSYSFTDSVGCISGDSGSVTVVPNPNAPVLSFSAPNLSINSTPDSVQWFFNGTYLLTNGPSIVPTQDGNYSAIVWVSGCSSDTSAALPVTLVGTTTANDLRFELAPNPAHGREVKVICSQAMSYNVTVCDALGRVVLPSQNVHGTGKISITDLADGVYFVRVQHESGTISLRMVVE
ncbi:MAG: T9SS type A sorting domain-containing protein [Bacteroidia bacterium]